MTCGEFKSRVMSFQGPINGFMYQPVPGHGTMNPDIEGAGPIYSVPEFDLKTEIAGWDDKSYVGVSRNESSDNLKLYATDDVKHKDDVCEIKPGNVVAIIGVV